MAAADLLARPAVHRLPRYVAGKPLSQARRETGLEHFVKLDSNENPLGPSPRALVAMRKAMNSLHRYPDTTNHPLEQALAARLGIDADHVVVGAGATALIKLVAEAFFRPGDEVVYATPSFPMYAVAASLMESTGVAVPLTPDGRHDLEAMLGAVGERTRAVFVCNPNNPTGTYVTVAEVEAFLDRLPAHVLVVLDEAYQEYAQDRSDFPDGLRFVRAGYRVLVLRTLSKIYGLAGLRIGFAVGPAEVAEALRRVREPFHVSAAAQAAAEGALDDRDHVARSVKLVQEGRGQLYLLCERLSLRYFPSAANFVYLDAGRDGSEVAQALLQRGVLVRPGGVFGSAGWLRVTVGLPEEIEAFGAALEAVLRQPGREP